MLSQLEQARQQQTLAEALNKRANELEEVQEPFVAAVLSLDALSAGRIVAVADFPDGGRVVDRVAAIRKQLADQPQDITKGQAFNLLCRAVKKFTEECDELITTSWNEHVKQKAPAVDGKLLSQYRNSPRHEDAVLQIERITRDLKGLVRKAPPNVETLNQIEELWEELRTHLRTLPVSDDVEVQAFLNAAISADGAPLDLLTTSVSKWLSENDMVADFCIRRSN